jgi:predicted dehydrogenase
MSDKIRVALIGAGGMANAVHYPSLVEFDDIEIVGLCDLMEDKLHATADKFGIEKRYTSYPKMLEETAPQAVYVLMPPHHLFDIAVDVMSRKLHLFMEKPPGVYHEQTHQMANCAEANGVIAMVGFNRRYIPLMRLCRDKCRDRGGVITQAVSSFYKWHTAGPYYNGATDILNCDAVHAVDALRWIGGDVKKVVGHVRNQGLSFDTAFNALCEFESGGCGVLLANWRVGGRIHQFEMHAEGISCYVNPDFDAKVLVDGGAIETLDSKEVAGSDAFHKYYGFYGENRAFIDAVKTGQEPESSIADAVNTMELVDRIYHNAL